MSTKFAMNGGKRVEDDRKDPGSVDLASKFDGGNKIDVIVRAIP
jgi:hypothetical protein